MNGRHFIAILCVACLALAGVCGVIHDHADKAGWCEEHHCTACHWQAMAVSDVPIVFILVVIGIAISFPVPDRSVSLPAIFPLASASRGPPSA